ncbi:E3 ubiquitin-protein ligase TRIM17-like [Sphaeramia orbicularis]|uniref:E3 ubiquitin-protein ligase TRIM17-like n=1 Tax=Sphaeramia orbicularis TaxID=375764 RepID=A0A673CGL1_9TELE|nr:E3 ubiquitin-protein ligase TRIM17-like [Sphaeramia orbicularis]
MPNGTNSCGNYRARRVKVQRMSSSSVLGSLQQKHFECSICLNIFNDPVTTPCGHSFCKTCLSNHWDRSELCHCPTCDKRFFVRPEISTTTIIEEISTQIKKRRVEVPENMDGPWKVKCDVCTEMILEAVKTCPVCQTSYCEIHLEPHHRVPTLTRHKLIDPVENIQERICEKHERILEMYCRDEEVCICLLCNETDHKHHQTVPTEEEGARQKENMKSRMTEINTMIESRTVKIQQVTDSSVTSTEKANKEISDSEALFNRLMSQIRDIQAQVKLYIEQKLRKSQENDGATIKELQEEITELQRKHSELEELLESDDYLHLLQTLPALNSSDTKDWSEVQVYSDVCLHTVRQAMSALVSNFHTELKTLTRTEITKMRQYKESVTFDASVAGSKLIVYESGKRLKCHKYAINPEPSENRFGLPMVLGTEGFTSGRHYWEVEVGLRSDWHVGVAKETVGRKGQLIVKMENGFYALSKSGLDYDVSTTRRKILNLCPRPRRIGVYLDYEGGRVSFYDVDQDSHIYSFRQQSFTDKLFPYFYLYSGAKKSDPLAIATIYERDYFKYLFLPKQQAPVVESEASVEKTQPAAV